MDSKTVWLPSLLKAVYDPFIYACELRGGRIVVFESATLLDACGKEIDATTDISDASAVAIRLMGVEAMYPAVRHEHLAFTFERGLDVRVADVIWCADAPWGS